MTSSALARRQIIRIAAWLSQGLNVTLLAGHQNETVSGRAYRLRWPIRRFINALFIWQDDHCRASHMRDIEWAREILGPNHE